MRLTLAGGGTDVTWYSKHHGGAWISAALSKYVTVTVRPHQTKQNMHHSIVKECLRRTNISSGINIDWESDAPAKSGLGGSGAFEVGLLHALHLYSGNTVSQSQLAYEAADIEINKFQMPVGPQDQYIVALGGIKYFEIDTRGDIFYENLQLSTSSIETLNENLLYFSTGIQHNTAQILEDVKQQANDTSTGVINMLHSIKSLGQTAKSYLISGQIDAFGKTFDIHWNIKRKLSESMSSQAIDIWYDEGRKAGALGGKIMGAGGGGWMVFYVPNGHGKFIERMNSIGLTYQKVSFDWNGTTQIK